MEFKSTWDDCLSDDSEEVSNVCSKCSSGLEATVRWHFGGLDATFKKANPLTVEVEGVAGEADFEFCLRTCGGW